MADQTNHTRVSALDVLAQAGYAVRALNRGQRVVVELEQHGVTIEELVKTGSLGRAMVTTSSGDPDNAKISGFGDDVGFVLFAIGDGRGQVAAYLVPREEAESAFRDAQRGWIGEHPDASDSTTWVVYFNDRGSPAANGYHKKWAKYRVEPLVQTKPTGNPGILVGGPASGHLTIGEAKRLLSISLGVPLESVKITIEA